MIKRVEHGFAMFELVLAIALASLVATWGVTIWMRYLEDALAQATGVWILTVHRSMNQMLRRESDFMSGLILDRSGAPQYVDLRAPTITELIRAGHLPKGFAATPPIPYLVSIRISAPEGDCANMGCRIEALIVAQPPENQQTEAKDVTRIGNILTAMQGVGASVHPLEPNRIKGPGLEMENRYEGQSNALPVGTIVSKSFYDSSRFAHLIRRSDPRDTLLEGRLGVKKDIASDANIHAKGGLRSDGRITAGEFLQLQGIAAADQSCEAEGLVARSSSADLLTCHAGRWRFAGGGFGGVYSMHSFYGCGTVGYEPAMSNPMTGGCFCPEGFNPVKISRWKDEISNLDEFRTYICLR
jgi:hypothetical protein